MQVTPQDITVVLCQVALFLFLFVVLKRFWFGPVAAVLHEREQRSAGALAEARALQARAEELQVQRTKALEQARSDAHHDVQELWRAADADQQRLMAAAHADAERTLGEAREQIAQEVTRARTELEGQVREIARQAVQAVVGRTVS
jgi:F-type H+-transporting ATPase subunit b